MTDENPNESFERLLERHNNDGINLARELFRENYQLREDRRDLNARVEKLQGRLPDEDAVVLAGDDAATWQQYQELGTPEEIGQSLEQAEADREARVRLERETTLRDVADAHGYDYDILSDLAGELTFEVREVTDAEADETRRVAFVTPRDAGSDGQEARLDQYAEAHWQKYLPVLAPNNGSDTDGARGAGTRYPGQSGGQGAGGGDSIVDKHIERQTERSKAATNPLRRKAQQQ